jgi:hypothetical protein
MASRIQLTRLQGSGGFGHTVIAVNMTTMRGGYVTDTPLTLTQTLQLNDVLPGGGSFILGFVWGRDRISLQTHARPCNRTGAPARFSGSRCPAYLLSRAYALIIEALEGPCRAHSLSS